MEGGALFPPVRFVGRKIRYTYTRMGPQYQFKGKDMFEKVISYRQYPGIRNKPKPKLIGRLVAVWSFGAALANNRILNPSVFGNFENLYRGRNGAPENMLARSCELLHTVISSRLRYYVAKAWIILRNTYLHYKRIQPSHLRDFDLRILIGASASNCLENAIRAIHTVSSGDHDALFMIGRSYRMVPSRNLQEAEKYLREAMKFLNKPGIYHHLALVCREKWLLDKCGIIGTSDNIRDPGNPLLSEAIGYLEKALEHNHQAGVLFLTDLARCKFSYAAGPFTEEGKQDILSTMNQSLVCIQRYSVTTKAHQAYAFFQLGQIHETFGNLSKSRRYLKLSIQMAVSTRKYAEAFPKLIEIVKKECEENPGIETYKMQAELYEIVQQHQKAIESYEIARELGGDNPAILEKLVENFCKESRYTDARQCLKLLTSTEMGISQMTEEKRSRFIGVSLKVGHQFMVDQENSSAAAIYQELITDLLPANIPPAFSKVVVLSSGERNDNPKTEILVKMLRDDLGFNEESCQWPYESPDKYGRDTYEFDMQYIKKTWCCVVHLTDVLLQDTRFMFKTMMDMVDVLARQPFGGHLVIIEDISVIETEEWQKKAEKFRSFPMIKYSELFGDTIDAATTCDKMVKCLLQQKD